MDRISGISKRSEAFVTYLEFGLFVVVTYLNLVERTRHYQTDNAPLSAMQRTNVAGGGQGGGRLCRWCWAGWVARLYSTGRAQRPRVLGEGFESSRRTALWP